MRKYPTNYKPNLYLGDDKIRFYLGNQGECTLFCLSINPSTANDVNSDPTMNSLLNIAKSKVFDGCIMINPAPFRSNTPQKLPKEPNIEIIEQNIEEIEKLFEKFPNNTMVCAWGNYYLTGPAWFKESLKDIVDRAKKHNIRLVCVSKNKSGQPAHISYLNRDHKFFDFGNGEYELIDYEPFL